MFHVTQPEAPSNGGASQEDGPLPRRSVLGEAALESLEAEARVLARSVLAEAVPGAWRHSEAQNRYRPVIEALMAIDGYIRRFRRTFLSTGRCNFPDSPAPRQNYLQWERLPRSQWLPAAAHLLKMGLRLYQHGPLRPADLDDPGAGDPIYFAVPKSLRDAGVSLIGRMHSPGWRTGAHYRVTEAQMRHFYYRTQIASLFGREFGTLLEIGGGYGGLCGELLRHFTVGRVLLVELPESVPLCWFYFSSLFDCRIQVLYRAADTVDPDARIIILAPWMLPAIEGQVDLAINTMSFQHMNRANLVYYFEQIDRLNTSRVYLVNRNTIRDREDVVIEQYPIPPRFRCLKEATYLLWTGAPNVVERFYVSN